MTTGIRISGMTCNSFAATLEQSLKTIPSAQTASVNLRNETATADGSVDVNALLAVIKNEGYRATLVNG